MPAELFELTCEQAAVGIAHLSLDERWLWINQRFCDIVGYPRDELMHLRLKDITHPDDIETTLELSHRARAGELPSYTIEKRYVRKDGTTVWGSLTVSAIRPQAGGPACFAGFLQDVTARRHAEQRLAARHAATRLLSDAPFGQLPRGLMEVVGRALKWDAAVLWTVDWSEDVLRRNDEWHSPRARSGDTAIRTPPLKPGQELPGRVWNTGQAIWVPDLGEDASSSRSLRIADTGLRGAVALPVRSSSGVCGVIELFSAEVQPRDEDLVQALTVIGDEVGQFIEHARTSEFVREAEVRKTAVVDAALDCIIAVDSGGRITEFNPAAERIFGHRRADVLGKSMPDLIIPAAHRPHHQAGFDRYVATGLARILGQRGEFTALRADGSEFPIELTVTKIPLPGPPTFTAFIRDITEQKAAEAELQQSLSLLRATLESTADGVLVVSNDGRITSYNKQLPAMFGIPESIFAIGNDSLALARAAQRVKDPDAFLERIRELNAQPEAEALDVIEFLDGRIAERVSRPQRLGGKSVGRVWSFRDVTERRRAEEAIRESELRFRSLTEAAVEGVLIHENGVVVDANPSFLRLFGYTLDEVVGRNILEMVVSPETRALIEERMRSSQLSVYEVEGTRKDGTRIAVELSARPSTYRGRPVRVAAIHDITERKRGEEATRRLIEEQAARSVAEAAERRSRILAEASRLLGMSFDYHTTLATLARLAVPTFADFCTVDVLEADRTISRLGAAHADHAKEQVLQELSRHYVTRVLEGPAALHLRKALETGESTIVPEISAEMLEMAGVDDEHREMLRQIAPRSLVAVALRSGERILGVASFYMSDSGRQYTAEDLALAEELARRAALSVENARLFHAAEQATRARDEMMGVVAHDLRNPLSTIRMASDLLLEIGGAQRPVERKQLEIMRRAADRMNRLIGDLLDVRRIEAGTLAVEPRPETVATLVGDAVEMLRPLAASSSLQLDAAVPDGLPRVMVDPPRVQQVLSNLVGNAIKFTPTGGSITVRAELTPDGVCLAVVDTGPGIPNDQLPHIFGRFWQGKRTDRRGVGLGLAIAKAIVEAHQGRIWVESQVGTGTSFYFTLPVVS
jgi:PAS domain S-box-containing protein